MKRKLLIEENDQLPNNYTGGRLDAFSSGMKEGAQLGTKIFLVVVIAFILYVIYFIKTW